MIIDSHVHISLYGGNAESLPLAFVALNESMRANGIGAAIVIPDNIEKSDNIADLEKAIELIGDKKNFYLLGSPQIIDRGSGEIEKYSTLIANGRIKGMKFFPGHDPYLPTDERCLPYYALCEKNDVPVLFHTGENSGNPKAALWNDPKHIVEVAKRFPKLKVIITHYYWPKMEYCHEITRGVGNIYFETAAMADEEVVEKSGGIGEVRRVLSKTIAERPDKVIFGTDWPMCNIDDHVALIKSLRLPPDIEEAIFSGNAANAYKISPV